MIRPASTPASSSQQDAQMGSTEGYHQGSMIANPVSPHNPNDANSGPMSTAPPPRPRYGRTHGALRPTSAASFDRAKWHPPMPGSQATELVGMLGSLGPAEAVRVHVSAAGKGRQEKEARRLEATRRSQGRPSTAQTYAAQMQTQARLHAQTHAGGAGVRNRVSSAGGTSALLPEGPGPGWAPGGARKVQSAQATQRHPMPGNPDKPVEMLATSVLKIMDGGKRFPDRSRGLGSGDCDAVMKRPTFRERRAQSAAPASRIGALRVTDHTGQGALLLDVPEGEDKSKQPVEEVLKEFLRQAKLKKQRAQSSRNRVPVWKQDMQIEMIDPHKVRMRAVGPIRRAVEAKLDVLRQHPHELEELQTRCSKYTTDFSASQKDVIEANRAQIVGYLPENRQATYAAMRDQREERTMLAQERKAESLQEHERRMMELFRKHDVLKARLATERTAAERHAAQQGRDAKVAAAVALAARLHSLARAVLRNRERRKLNALKAASARRIQRWWRRMMVKVRQSRAAQKSVMVYLRWKYFVKLRRRQRAKGAERIRNFLSSLESASVLSRKFTTFNRRIRYMQMMLRKCFLRFEGMAKLVERQWVLAENDLNKARHSKLENPVPEIHSASPNASPRIAQASDKKEDKRKKDAKGKSNPAKDSMLLPLNDSDGVVPSATKRLVCMRYIRIKRRGYHKAMRLYEQLKEEYDDAIEQQWWFSRARTVAGGGKDDDAPKLMPPTRPSVLNIASAKELKILMQTGVYSLFTQREEAVNLKTGSLDPDYVFFDPETELRARGIEEYVERKPTKKKIAKVSKATEGAEKGGEKPVINKSVSKSKGKSKKKMTA